MAEFYSVNFFSISCSKRCNIAVSRCSKPKTLLQPVGHFLIVRDAGSITAPAREFAARQLIFIAASG
jgi:hypothetical protein